MEFRNSDLGGSTYGEHSLMLLMYPNMILHPSPYVEIPNKPRKPMLDGTNTVNSAATMSQRAQPQEPEARVYESKSEVWTYDLLTAGKMSTKARLSCVYISLPRDICQLTINQLATLWYVRLLLQEKLEELDQKYLLVQFFSSVPGKTLIIASDYMIRSRIKGGWGSMVRIDQEVEIRDTVIKQLLSTSVPLPLPMLEDDVARAILKYDGQK